MYEVVEISLADLTRAYQFIRGKSLEAGFGIKGFDYPWLVASRSWQKGERVLDVGGAYSGIALHLNEEFGCEAWVADDFGLGSEDPFWRRGSSPQDYIREHPQVKYVLERLGDPAKSSLRAGSFDVVYSLSVLEHVPQTQMRNVLGHIDTLLKPGGEMLHAVDVLFPSNRGLWKVAGSMLFDAFYGLVPMTLKTRFCFSSPKAYTRLVLETLGVRYRLGRNLSVLNMVLNPDIVTESLEYVLRRIEKDGQTDCKYQRIGSLLIHLRKTT